MAAGVLVGWEPVLDAVGRPKLACLADPRAIPVLGSVMVSAAFAAEGLEQRPRCWPGPGMSAT
ncbi:hypothetical protein [Streptomyces sp. NPDC002580]|uniref:hypothetical protein n=1 Tax=Streptomyces sp. NPDC002580 TaxID=3364653 RepID=UPI00369E861A